jgi:tetratricopeptide (TPR) repeat protein
MKIIHQNKIVCIKLIGLLLAVIAVTFMASTALATDLSKESKESKEIDSRRSTAVALNYCRASFCRIRKNPTKQVMVEERDQILNNLNLNEIADEEVVKLYTGVLEEIADVQLAEKEQVIMGKVHTRAFTEKLALNTFALGAELTTFQYGSAIRTGANSWWDYRNMQINKDRDYLRIEKQRVNKIVNKSSLFLDTFWKLARKKNIPDRWLVRSTDLHRLEVARNEKDPQVRLRIFKRMERFMECYPPYWYYVARTHQALGQNAEAAIIYQRLADTGEGHFRKDEMLAAGLANLAAIQAYGGKPEALETALKALEYDTDAWEVNLICAKILEAHGNLADAEDAILRNLDVDLEKIQSQTSLLALYYRTNNKEKLVKQLSDPEVVAIVPSPALLLCLSILDKNQIPAKAIERVNNSFVATVDLNFGMDDIVIQASPSWQLQFAKLTIVANGKEVEPKFQVASNGFSEARFANFIERGTPLNSSADLLTAKMKIVYPNQKPFYIHLNQIAGTSGISRNPTGRFSKSYPAGKNRLVVTGVEIGKTMLSFLPQDQNVGKPVSQTHLKKLQSPSIRKTSSKPHQVLKPIPRITPLGVQEFPIRSSEKEKQESIQ